MSILLYSRRIYRILYEHTSFKTYLYFSLLCHVIPYTYRKINIIDVCVCKCIQKHMYTQKCIQKHLYIQIFSKNNHIHKRIWKHNMFFSLWIFSYMSSYSYVWLYKCNISRNTPYITYVYSGHKEMRTVILFMWNF